MNCTIDNPVILITGASGTLGRALATNLKHNGCRLALHFWRRVPDMPQCDSVKHIRCDLSTSPESVIPSVIEHFGRIDGLINNAAIRQNPSLISETDPGEFDKVMALNLRAPFILMSQTLQWMVNNDVQGRIVNILSIVENAMYNGSAYAAAKSALGSLTRSAALELADTGISVNALSPGPVATDRSGMPAIIENAHRKVQEDMLQTIPARRLCQPEEAASIIRFLLLEAPSYMTGQTISVNGGMGLQPGYIVKSGEGSQ